MSCRDCNKCELSKFANNTCIQGVGNERARVMIVGDNPNYQEDNQAEYGKGNPHKLMLELLHSAGIKYSDCYYTPAVKCRKAEKGKVSATQLKACKEYLQEEFDRVKPEYVITLGATALKALTNKAKITEIHGKTIEHKQGFIVLPTFHPAMSLRDPRFWDSIHTDFRRFGKVIRGEGLVEHKLNFERITDKLGLIKVLDTIRRSQALAYDLETNGLEMRYRTSEIGQTVIANFSIVYVVEHECFSHEELDEFHGDCNQLMQGKEVCGWNAKFDNLWLHYRHGVRFPLTFDGMLASHLLDENSPNGLKQNARSILEMEDWDVPTHIKNGKGKKKKGLTEEEKLQRAEYAAWDGYATIRLCKYFKQRLAEEPELENLFRHLVMPVARTYEQVEINGVHVDLERMAEAEKILKKKLRMIGRKLDRHLKRAGVKEINWNSPDQIVEVLFNKMNLKPEGYTEKGAPSTAEDNLKKMRSQHPIIPVLLEYRGVFKQLSGFIEGWAKRMIDGKLHPGFKIPGTVTGRPSCADPNLQQVPRDPFIRSLIGAPEGYDFFEVDYSQVELRIAACLSGESKMLQVFRSGGDIHESTYHMIMGMSTAEAVAHIEDPDERKAQLKEERKKAKAINFGFIYGMGWKKFMEYCENKMDLIISEKEARAWRKRYFEIYSGLPGWHDRQRRIVRAMQMVRTLTGRIRHLPQINSPDQGLASEAERNAINAPVQGFGAELILMSLVEVNDYFGNNIVKLGGTIHDAMVGIVKKEHTLSAMARIKKIMESPRIMREFGIELPLPLIADVSVGNWGIGKEYNANELPEPYEINS